MRFGSYTTGGEKELLDLRPEIIGVGEWAGRLFDEGEWKYTPISVSVENAWSELADLQVVIFCLAEALNELTNQDSSCAKRLDITQLALTKAQGDVQRGVR